MPEPILCGPRLRWAPLLPKLRGHFAEFLNDASSVGLRILSSSTCVGLRYGYSIHYSGFSRQPESGTSLLVNSLRITSLAYAADLPTAHLLSLHRSFLSRFTLSFCVPTVLISILQCRNLHLLSIGYALRPRLRSRLTQGRSALPWKPWIFGRKDSHLPLATHSGILSSIPSTAPYRYSFNEYSMLLYQ